MDKLSKLIHDNCNYYCFKEYDDRENIFYYKHFLTSNIYNKNIMIEDITLEVDSGIDKTTLIKKACKKFIYDLGLEKLNKLLITEQ